MKKYFVASVMLFLVVFPMSAQLLWKVSGKGLKQDSYLFGTHHLISISFLDSIPGLYPAFNSSKAVVSEIVLNTLDATQKIQTAATLPDSMLMSRLLSSEEFEMLDKEISDLLKITLKQIDMLHPAMIQTFFQLELYKQMAHFDDNTKSDSYFQLVANEKGMPIYGLETIDKQVELLFPKEDLRKQALELVDVAKRKNEAYAELKELNRLYKIGDINGLDRLNKISNTNWGVSDEENAEMVDNRNIDWANQLPALMKSNPCFIAVGALHLPGENGLIKLLRKKGYRVRAIVK